MQVKKTTIEDLENLNSKKITEEDLKKLKIWYPFSFDKNYTIRIIDPEDQDWIKIIHQHYIPTKNGKKNLYTCPTTFGEKCPVCERNLQIFAKFKQKNVSQEESYIFQTTKRRTKYAVQILVREYENAKDESGHLINPVKLYYMPLTLKDLLIFWSKSRERGGRGAGELWNNIEGRDIDIIKTKKNFQNYSGKTVIMADYKLSSYNDKSPLAADKNLFKEYLKSVHKWDDVIEKDDANILLEAYNEFIQDVEVNNITVKKANELTDEYMENEDEFKTVKKNEKKEEKDDNLEERLKKYKNS